MSLVPYKSNFVVVNGIRLNYLDWGDRVFHWFSSPGLGCSPHIFGSFAQRFVNHFRVIGFSRRGHGDSDYPDTGYDADTLREDIYQFLNTVVFSQDSDQVILVGHSLDYVELT